MSKDITVPPEPPLTIEEKKKFVNSASELSNQMTRFKPNRPPFKLHL